jgi:hypothetical protein
MARVRYAVQVLELGRTRGNPKWKTLRVFARLAVAETTLRSIRQDRKHVAARSRVWPVVRVPVQFVEG